MSTSTPIHWNEGMWTHAPAHVEQVGDELHVTSVEGSDAWRLTSYGFVHDTEHALVAPFPDGSGMEVEFTTPLTSQFDQAGIFVSASPTRWVKAGVEFADGTLQIGAVVTDEMSDWSASPVPAWLGEIVRIRVSRGGNALTVRAGLRGGDLHLIRVIPFAADLVASAGPLTCAPTRAGLEVAFLSWTRTSPDDSLHS